MRRERAVVAIDGHSSCGKSTFARAIAKRLGYHYLDTGAMYRAVAYACLTDGLDWAAMGDCGRVMPVMDRHRLDFYRTDRGTYGVTLNGEDVEPFLRSPEVSAVVSTVAALPCVREALTAQQRDLGREGGLVMDGRDIGSAVFPDAEVKIFMTARAEVRAQRRYAEQQAKGLQQTYEEVLENLLMRDRIDSERACQPLVQAPDALLLDNSDMTVEDQMAWFEEHIVPGIPGVKKG